MARARSIIISVLVLVLVLTGGCTVDKGSALAADFDAAWSDTPDIAEIKSQGNSKLPFTGSAVGELIFHDGTSADRVVEVAGELQAYIARNDDISGVITVDGISFDVVDDPDRNSEMLTLWRALATDDRVLGGSLYDVTNGDFVQRRLRVKTVDPETAMEVFDDMATDGGRYQPLAETRSLIVQTELNVPPWLHVETEHGGGYPDLALRAYRAVALRFPIAGATLRAHLETRSEVRIVLTRSTDRAAATEVAKTAAPGLTITIIAPD